MLTEILLLSVSLLIFLLYFWQRKTFTYWKRHNVPYAEPKAFVGNLHNVVTQKRSFYQQFNELYKSSNEPLLGVYTLHKPGLLIRDLDLVKRVMIKDFNSFSNRVVTADPIHDQLGESNLFFLRNPKWRELRPKLTQLYTSGKVKQMYVLMVEIAKELEFVLEKIPNASAVDVKTICMRFTSDLIASTAFGLRANSLKNSGSEFYSNNMRMFECTVKRSLEFACIYFMPFLVKLLRVKVFSAQGSKFLRETIRYAISERERTGSIRHDLIDSLLILKKEHKSLDFLVAQAAIFNIAGFETSSSAMSFALYELALQENIQNRLREEINEAFESENNGENISYEKIHEMPYLSMIFDETLRKYPIVGYAERQCTPLKGTETYSLEPYSKFEIPEGMPIYVSHMGIQRDEKYWPNPDKFDPERFSPENKSNINWNAYMPFGIGPHNCIGMRLGALQTKLGLVHFLRTHKVSACKETVSKVEFDPKGALMTMKGNIILNVEKV